MTGALIKLREGRRRRSPIWTVEICRRGTVVYRHTFENRAEARHYARRVASENQAVVVLAGPDAKPTGKLTALARGGAA